jgi:hypothetical protein
MQKSPSVVNVGFPAANKPSTKLPPNFKTDLHCFVVFVGYCVRSVCLRLLHNRVYILGISVTKHVGFFICT